MLEDMSFVHAREYTLLSIESDRVVIHFATPNFAGPTDHDFDALNSDAVKRDS